MPTSPAKQRSCMATSMRSTQHVRVSHIVERSLAIHRKRKKNNSLWVRAQLYAVNRERFLANEEIVNHSRMFSSANHSRYTVYNSIYLPSYYTVGSMVVSDLLILLSHQSINT